MKKNIIIPTSTALLGILIGFFIFSTKTGPEEESILEVSQAESTEIWTCSMHPQIRKKEPGKCPICGMTLIPGDDNGSDTQIPLEMTENAVKLSNIQTTVIGDSEAATDVLQLSGKIQKNEEKAANLVSQIGGRIEKLYVSYIGEQVNKGQKIAEIYSPVLINAQKELLEADKVKESNPELLDAAIRKLRNWKITNEQITAILAEQKVPETISIYAEYTGVILNKKVSVGDHLADGEVLFAIQNLSSLWVVFDAYEKDLGAIQIGNEITFTTTAYPSETFNAKVDFIDPYVNESSRTVSIRAEVNNAERKLKPEMFVQGTIQLSESPSSTKNNTLLVPKSSVMWTGVRSVVYVKKTNTEIPSFEYREIELGQTVGNHYMIKSGLKKGEEVVTNGAFVIDAASQLNNRSSMMNRNVRTQ